MSSFPRSVADELGLRDSSISAAPPIAIGLVGVGKIAKDQHLPALATNPAFQLAATASRHGGVDGLASFPDIERMIAGTPRLDAVSLCAPPSVRAAMARAAISAGLAVMLEKPPGVTVSETTDLMASARRKSVTLFASWHSREAPAVEPARQWLQQRRVTAVRVSWLEDVRVWHPGQEWIWQAGGFGVFDPGVNALSILTHILPGNLVLTAATLSFPRNRDTPIEAQVTMAYDHRATVELAFNFRYAGAPRWDIEIETTDGAIALTHGGAKLYILGTAIPLPASAEYPRLYARFASLIRAGQSEVDLAPLQLVADAFLCGRRIEVEPFSY